MPTAESRVAKTLNITEAEAREFISLVRGMFGEPPTDEWIVGYLEAVAVRLRALGWVSARRKQESVSGPKKAQTVSGRNEKKDTTRPKEQKSGSQSKQVKRRKPRKQGLPRVSGNVLGTCLHGIPKTSLCAICNPKKFAEEGDPD